MYGILSKTRSATLISVNLKSILINNSASIVSISYLLIYTSYVFHLVTFHKIIVLYQSCFEIVSMSLKWLVPSSRTNFSYQEQLKYYKCIYEDITLMCSDYLSVLMCIFKHFVAHTIPFHLNRDASLHSVANIIYYTKSITKVWF